MGGKAPVLTLVPKYSSLEEINLKFKKGSVEWYEAAYSFMEFDAGMVSEISHAASRVLSGKDRYVAVSKQTGVPWRVIGCLHNMECNCNFHGVLHNGQLIVGTGRRTTIVPVGKGPFNTWEESALDALKSDGLSSVKTWTLGLELKWAEIFNGLGYLKYHPQENSPYVWACTSINDGTGKYVADGKYDTNANANTQVGVAAIYKQIDLMGQT